MIKLGKLRPLHHFKIRYVLCIVVFWVNYIVSIKKYENDRVVAGMVIGMCYFTQAPGMSDFAVCSLEVVDMTYPPDCEVHQKLVSAPWMWLLPFRTSPMQWWSHLHFLSFLNPHMEQVCEPIYFMGLLPDMWNCELRMHRECQEHFPRHHDQTGPAVSAQYWGTWQGRIGNLQVRT